MLLLLTSTAGGGGGWTPPVAFKDCTTVYSAYLATLRAANPGKDLTTIMVGDHATVRSTVGAEDDENTLYDSYLS